jgi:hypothetical protein
MPTLPPKHRKKIESVERNHDVIIYFLKGWIREDGAHQVSYEPDYHDWSEVLKDFERLVKCRCDECVPAPTPSPRPGR